MTILDLPVFPGSEPASMMRRRFLHGAPALVLLAMLPPGLARAADLSDAELPGAVRQLVKRRELLEDAMRPFRRGASVLIDTVMEQYAVVQAEFAGRTPPRLMALRWALQRYLDEAGRATYGKAPRCPHTEGSVTSFGTDSLKCNKLVADAYATGAGKGLSTGPDWSGPGDKTGWPAELLKGDLWPPQANRLADQKLNIRSLTNARPLRQPDEPKAAPDLGDLIAFPSSNGSGHVGLYLGKNLIVSAKETGIEIHPLEYEQALHGGVVVIRKFTGTGR